MMTFHDEALAPPTYCHNCESPHVYLTTNAAVYGPYAIDPDAKLYRCRTCRAGVGVHEGTDLPMGYLADSATRALRVRAHTVFDPIWQNGRITRTKAYRLLADALGLSVAQCHIGLLSQEQLRGVIEFCREYHSEAVAIQRRRVAKKFEKMKERNEREYFQRKRAIDADSARNKRHRR